MTHLQADGDFYSRLSLWWGGDAEYRRSVEMSKIHKESDKWAKEPPQLNLKHRHTIFMGDINTCIECPVIDGKVDDTKWLGLETVDSAKLKMKHPGKFELLQHYEPMVPENTTIFLVLLKAAVRNLSQPQCFSIVLHREMMVTNWGS